MSVTGLDSKGPGTRPQIPVSFVDPVFSPPTGGVDRVTVADLEDASVQSSKFIDRFCENPIVKIIPGREFKRHGDARMKPIGKNRVQEGYQAANSRSG